MKTKRIRILDGIGLAVLVAAALGGLLWTAGNMVLQKRQFQQENDLMARQRAGLQRADENLQSLRRASIRVQTDSADLYRRIPPDIEMGALLKKLQARMKERRIRLAILQPEPAVSEELYRKIPIRLVFQGGFAQIYRFIHDLEAMDQLLVMEKMTIAGSESSPGGCQVDLTLLAIERKKTRRGGEELPR